MDGLENYRQLVQKVDALCRNIATSYSHYIACRPGCNTCCKHLSIFPVEGAAMASYLRSLPGEKADHIRRHAGSRDGDDQCPLQDNGLCLLYDARPLICRTHGLPIMTTTNGNTHVDFCPMNFTEVDSLPGSAVIKLETLNASLAAINAMFVAQDTSGLFNGMERLSLAEAVLLDFCVA